MASQKTKDKIVAALIALMRKKPIGQITVKELAYFAGINRSTFYYHFTEVEDVIEHMMETFLANTRAIYTLNDTYTFEQGEGSAKVLAISEAFFNQIYENRDQFRAIVNSSYKQRFYDDLVRIFVEQFRSLPHWWKPEGELVRMRSLERDYWDRSWSHLALGIVEQWLLRDFEESPEEVSNLTLRLLTNVNGFELKAE